MRPRLLRLRAGVRGRRPAACCVRAREPLPSSRPCRGGPAMARRRATTTPPLARRAESPGRARRGQRAADTVRGRPGGRHATPQFLLGLGNALPGGPRCLRHVLKNALRWISRAALLPDCACSPAGPLQADRACCPCSPAGAAPVRGGLLDARAGAAPEPARAALRGGVPPEPGPGAARTHARTRIHTFTGTSTRTGPCSPQHARTHAQVPSRAHPRTHARARAPQPRLLPPRAGSSHREAAMAGGRARRTAHGSARHGARRTARRTAQHGCLGGGARTMGGQRALHGKARSAVARPWSMAPRRGAHDGWEVAWRGISSGGVPSLWLWL